MIKTDRAQETEVVGKGIPQIYGIEKATGAAKFTVNVELPGMLHAKFLRSPHAHARIVRIDTSRAEKLPGVKGILTFNDIPKVKYNPNTRFNFFGELPNDMFILSDKARYVGDRIAVVAATCEEVAEEAVSLIDVEYETLPAVFDPEEALKPDAPKIHGDESNVIQQISLTHGDVERGFKEADFVFEDEFKTQINHQVALEPHVCIADFALEGNLEIISSTQVPFQVRHVVAKVLKLPINKVRVIKPHVGGGFGGKDEVFDEIIAALLSKKTGKPVKVEMSREEDFIATTTRHAFVVRLKMGVKNDGTLTALQVKSIQNAGAYCTSSPRVLGAQSARTLLRYRIPNYKFDGYSIYTNLVPGGGFRGYGGPQINFPVESLMDTVAERLGIDRVEIRLKNCVRKGDQNFTTKGTIESCGLQEGVAKCLERMDWYGKKPRTTSDGRKRGLGLAIDAHVTSSFPRGAESSEANVTVNEDGTINLEVGSSDIGTSSDTVMCQIAAEELGLEIDDVSIASGDTRNTGWDVGAYASKTTYIAGNAVKKAAAAAKEKIIQQAAKILAVAPEGLECKHKRIYARDDPTKSITLPDLIQKILASGEPFQITGTGSFSAKTNAPNFTVHCVEVLVDPETGKIEIPRYVTAVDAGTVMNPVALEGQVEGSVHMGLGYALTEELLFAQSGEMLNSDLVDYKILPAIDTPRPEIIIIPTYEPTGPFGAKGAGEGSLVPALAAVANAVYDATGVRIKELPITFEKLYTAMKKKEG